MPHFYEELFTPKRIYIVLGIFALSNLIATAKTATSRDFLNSSDFAAYSIGARMVLDGQGKNLYDLKLQINYWDRFLRSQNLKQESFYILPYIAPPLTAVIFLPYLFISQSISAPIGASINAIPILAGALILGKSVKSKKLALFTTFSSWFVWSCIVQVQPTSWLFLTTVLLYWSLQKEKLTLAGALCAFYVIKPQYLAVVPLVFLLTRKNSTFAKSFLLSFVVLSVLNILISGPHTLFIDYPKLLIATDNPNYGNRWYAMYSIQQLSYHFLRYHNESKILPLAIGAAFYLWGSFKISRHAGSKKPVADLFPLVIIVSLLSAYHVYPQDMSLIAIAISLLVQRSIDTKRYRDLWLLIIYQITGTFTGIDVGALANYYGVITVALVIYFYGFLPTTNKLNPNRKVFASATSNPTVSNNTLNDLRSK